MDEPFVTSGWTAVSNQRVEPRKGLDDFPTPPWATRALMEIIDLHGQTVWEPAAGRGIMSEVLKEQAADVFATDIVSYEGSLDMGGPLDFLTAFWPWEKECDWVITNPPFNLAVPFTLKALKVARTGVAILARSNWVESVGRYQNLFYYNPPSLIMPFCERVPMVKGCYDPGAGTATSYSWFVWEKHSMRPHETLVRWIRPGRKRDLFRESDLRFAPPKEQWPSEIRKAQRRRLYVHPT